ncbi:MAG: alpha-amylase/4-alpha-glucanotransferase domain-containing protein [Longimicrobiales bacterium]
MTEPTTNPVLFTFGLHAHQPEGNFGHVFEEHLRDVYEPFLHRAVEDELLPLTFHLSGPLLDWLRANGSTYLDLIGELASAGKLELLLAGYYEPILPSLPPQDRVEQIIWMREALKDLFGIEASGLWLTERVWEPELAADLVDAGVQYVIVDDRHFVAAGFSRESLHAPFRTEASGKSLGVFAIDEKLRYMIPFQPPEDTARYLKELRSQGRRLAVIADDIEKFGGWPGTREWVYDRGWLEKFTGVMKELEEQGEIRLATFRQALDELPSGGLAYLPSASYREMEEWSLPPEAFHRIAELKEKVGEDQFARGESPLIRGSHWRNFLVKYPEANRMHKKMMELSALCRTRGNPDAPRRLLGRAQCNDAYWHGVFGGLYLRHLRETVWRNLSEAERILRQGESLGWEQRDLDLDGHGEIWIHSQAFSAQVSPQRGGSVEELTLFGPGINLANTLTRRREAYHEPNGLGDGVDEKGRAEQSGWEGNAGGEPSYAGERGNPAEGGHAPSIHDLEEGLRFRERPPVDPDERALFLERVLGKSVTETEYRNGTFHPVRSWAREALEVGKVVGIARGEWEALSNRGSAGRVGAEMSGSSGLILKIQLTAPGPGSLEKSFFFQADGTLEAHILWDPSPFPSDAFFTTELSVGAKVEIDATPFPELWRFPITTFSKSERGFDETVQGESILLRWPVAAGRATVRVRGM